MAGYTKLFSSIVHSTVWRAPDHVRLVWITMLAITDRDGVVEASVPGLADAARVSLPQCEEALDLLSSPDKYSRTKDHEGRRIEKVDGGWLLLNYEAYRERMSADERRIKARERKRRQRARGKAGRANVTPGVTPSHGLSQVSRQAEAEAEADLKAPPKEKAGSSLRSDHAREGSDPLLSDFERVERGIVAKRKALGKAWRRGAKQYDPVMGAAEAVRAQADDEAADFDAVLVECLDGWASEQWTQDKGYPVGPFLADPLKHRGLEARTGRAPDSADFSEPLSDDAKAQWAAFDEAVGPRK